MFTEIALAGGLVGAVLGVFEVSARLRGLSAADLTREAAVRELMRGSEAEAVRAEYRRSGIIPPVRPRW